MLLTGTAGRPESAAGTLLVNRPQSSAKAANTADREEEQTTEVPRVGRADLPTVPTRSVDQPDGAACLPTPLSRPTDPPPPPPLHGAPSPTGAARYVRQNFRPRALAAAAARTLLTRTAPTCVRCVAHGAPMTVKLN